MQATTIRASTSERPLCAQITMNPAGEMRIDVYDAGRGPRGRPGRPPSGKIVDTYGGVCSQPGYASETVRAGVDFCKEELAIPAGRIEFGDTTYTADLAEG